MDKYVQTLRQRDQHQSIAAVNRLGGVLDNVWLIVLVCALVTALGIMHALTATPLYEAGTVIQIKRNAVIPGDFHPEDNVRTEMEVLKSRSILARVVERLQLDVTLDPVPPTVGGAINRMLDRDQSAGSPVSPHTQLHIVRFELPAALFSRPLTLTITARQGFHLASEELGISVHGIAGTPVRVDSRYGTIELLIGRIAAVPGSRFVLRRISAEQATEQLQRALAVTENAKQSNVIKLTLQGADQQLMSRILGEVVAEYMHQRRTEQRSEAAQLAASYDRQLMASKAAVQKVDNQYAGLLRRSGIGDPEAEGQLLLQQSSALEMQLAAAQQRKAELSARIGDGHPEMQALAGQIADTSRVLRRNAAKYESLSVAARELAQVRREKQALDEAALALANQRGKLDAVTSAERDDVRVLERPTPSLHPVTLGKSTMVILSCFGGIAAGLLASFIKNLLFQRKRVLMSTQRNTRFRLIAQGRAG